MGCWIHVVERERKRYDMMVSSAAKRGGTEWSRSRLWSGEFGCCV